MTSSLTPEPVGIGGTDVAVGSATNLCSRCSKVSWSIGWGLTALIGAVLLMGSVMAMTMKPEAAANDEMFVKLGMPFSVMFYIGIALLISTILYLIPQTAVLGAILLTGYFGGACAIHVRAEQMLFVVPVLFGMLVWFTLYLRLPTVRVLIPIYSLRRHKTI